MKEFNWKSAALFTLSSIFVGIVTQACGGDNAAVAQSTPPTTVTAADPIEGLWQSNVTLKDCASGATVGAFRGLTTLHQGGTASADNNQPSPTKGPALGTWKKTATGYTIDLRFWRYLADGTPAGQQRLTRVITLAADGKSLTSTITTNALDATDNIVQSACGVETGAKIG
jgi:hypothetical protein